MSGVPAFRDRGGKTDGNVWGRYAVAVCISRFDDRYVFPNEEKLLRAWAHCVLNGLLVHLNIVADDVTEGWTEI